MLDGTRENYQYYLYRKKYYKIDSREHVIDMEDINTFPKPETWVSVTAKYGHEIQFVARVGVTGISWLWDIKNEPYGEFLSNGQKWKYII